MKNANREYARSHRALPAENPGAHRTGVWVGTAWLCCALCCLADPPSGDYRIDFGEETPLWDISGSYFVDLARDPFEQLALSFEMEMDSHGAITGSGGLDLDILHRGTHLRAGMEAGVVGRVFSARGKVRACLRFRLKGEGMVNGLDALSCCRVVAILELDPARRALVGRCAGSFAMTVPGQGRRCLRISPRECVVPLPNGTEGWWSLHLENIQTSQLNASRLTGAASIQLFNGRILPLEVVHGVYWSRLEESALVCGAGHENALSRGVRISLRAGQGSELSLKRVVIRCLGQTLSLHFSPGNPG